MTTRLEPRDDGWFEWVEDDGLDVYAQLQPGADGRLHVSALHVEGPVTADMLRRIPIGRIEAAANASFHPLATGPSAASTDPRLDPSAFESTGRGRPDSFYESVASAYQALALSSHQPVVLLAEANEVPRSTAHRWVKEARRRGLLPPGHPGKAG